MRAPVLRTQVSAAARRPGRLLLTGLAILVASFVVYGTVLAQQITERTARDNLSDTPAATDLVVGDPDAPRPTVATLARVRAVPGVAEAVGRLELGLTVNESYLNLRADPGRGPLATIRLIEGSYPDAPGEVAITPRTAERLGLAVGSVVTATDAQPTPVRLSVTGMVGTADDAGFDGYAPENVVTAVGGVDEVTRIDLRVAPGESAETVRQRVAAALPAGTPVSTGTQVRQREADAAADQVGALFALVGMFVAIAVVAAALVVTSTFRIVFAQRMRQLALLRAVGANRGALVRALTAEGALTGSIASAVGVAAALGVGHAVPAIMRAAGLAVSSPGLPVRAAVAVVLGAVLLTALAVLAPAFSAARVAPLEALRAASTTAGRRGIGAVRLVSGLLFAAGAVLAGAVAASRLPAPEQENYSPRPVLLLLVASGAVAFFALVALGPLLVRPVLAVVGWPLRQLGPVGRLAVGGVGGTPRRAAAVSVVVALGVTLIAGVAVGGASLRVLMDRELALLAPADIEVTGSAGATLPDGVVARAEAARGTLARVVPYRRVDGLSLTRGAERLGSAESGYPATDLDVRALPTTDRLDVAQGRLADLGPGRVVLGEWVARDTGLRVGDTVALTVAARTTEVRVAAVLPDHGPLHAGILTDRADLDRLGVSAAYSGLLADAARPGEDGRTAAVQALRQAIDGAEGVGLSVLADGRDRDGAVLDAILWIAVGLVSLTVVIAVVGVGSTTALSVVERVTESGLLRAVGLSRAALRTMLTAESGLYGLIGATIGLLLGVPYAWLAVRALGINAPLVLPVLPLVALFAALIVLTALAGVLPARRASRVSPVVALETDG
ncbi:putative ABC transport system permease protein [Micromonospora rhizosphaerae]|uniref:Putative ABC transport system permease protein n=1 Tax=Micromonospora rhizosphaerae TaxID=568872 RepID=A0A1C6T9U5_9ACTN|nr:FtsX-like permease family protein [Micromonospora rhizosphaerae]SCL38352.1 putative ABC transport system permease protein [Micromonospora rhizosphaerae]